MWILNSFIGEIDNNNIYIQLPIGLEEYILKKALKDIIDKSLIDFINKAILNKDFNNLVCRLN